MRTRPFFVSSECIEDKAGPRLRLAGHLYMNGRMCGLLCTERIHHKGGQSFRV